MEIELARVRTEFLQFSNRLSHDVQGIFSNIEGFARALRAQGAGAFTVKQEHQLQRIEAGARRGDSIMRDLASLSAATVTQARLQPVNLAELVNQCIRDLSSSLAGRAVEWEMANRPWPRVVADPVLLRLAVDHLLGNAVKFTRGRAPGRIRIEMAATPEEWVITVADNGAGFDPAYGGRLFKPFERLHLATEFEGNGVGLAMVKMVAERHGGRVRAEAPPGGGAIFTLTLRHSEPDSPSTQHGLQQSAAAAPEARSNLLILVVDDEPLVLATIRLILERDGHEVVTAGAGAAAIDALQRQEHEPRGFDLVISDWAMPTIGGADVVRAARVLQPDARIIVLTGQRPTVDDQYDLSTAVDHVLAKPVTPAGLRSAVATALGWQNRPD